MSSCLYGPAHEILVNIANAQKPQINANVDISIGSRGLDLGLRFHLYPYFVYASSDGSEESAHMQLPLLVDRVKRNTVFYSMLDHFIHEKKMGAQWLSGRVLDSRPKGRGFEPHRRHCVVSLSKNINPSLVLVQPRKTRPFITERLLMGREESNQTNKQIHENTNRLGVNHIALKTNAMQLKVLP